MEKEGVYKMSKSRAMMVTQASYWNELLYLKEESEIGYQIVKEIKSYHLHKLENIYSLGLKVGDTVTHTKDSGQIGHGRECEILSIKGSCVELLVKGLCRTLVHVDCIELYKK